MQRARIEHGVNARGAAWAVVSLDVARVRRALARHGERFVARVLTRQERLSVAGARMDERIAERIAAKLAFARITGTGSWQTMEIGRAAGKPPYLTLAGDRQAAQLSLSHERELAAALVMLQPQA